MTKRYFTTGEVAEICGVSRSTIVRRFDAGEIQGAKNVVTSERRIARKSLLAFMENNGIPLARLDVVERTVLLASQRPEDAEVFRAALAESPCEPTVASDWLSLADALNHNVPSLLFLDIDFQDIPAPQILGTLAQRESFKDMKVVVFAASDEVPLEGYRTARIMTRPLRESAIRDTVMRYLTPEPEEVVGQQDERRAWRRLTVDEEAEVAILLGDGSEHARGRARVENISEGGALLTNLELGSHSLPTEPFRLQLAKRGGNRLPRLNAVMEPVRVTWGQGLALGGRFPELKPEDREEIRNLLAAVM